MELGKVMKAARLKAEMSQEELAGRLYINQSDVSRIEGNKKVPDAVTFLRWFQETELPHVSAALITGVDPSMLADFINQIQNFAPFMSGFINIILRLI